MRKCLQILCLSLGVLILTSCEEEVAEFDDINGQTYVRFASSIVELPVVFDSSAEIEIPVQVNTISETERTITVDVVATGAENEATPEQYSVGNSVTIPANSYRGTLSFTGIDNGIEIGETRTVTLEITDISGTSDASLDVFRRTTVNLFQVCPVPSDFFIGEYQLTTTAPGIFGSVVFGQAVVTLEQGDSSSDARKFTSEFVYPELGTFGPVTFNFTLVCGTVLVASGQDMGIGCTINTNLGPSNTAGGYEADDDSILVIDFVDDEGGRSCAAETNASITLTKI
ncbi:hypothetical protein [Robiginitalea aurantiaca]|uniref:Calx-beta domain-containing protein n=1 Tax=Robiginitalea aurantiaca TaxID=3056915 RepID=A0ABT7WHA9_9FLAO|nr:hypothetical protein [Robiginitalea aurantiaca]MDM9632243.1 hypothetical protein [Robiginitalea aurantiaca]